MRIGSVVQKERVSPSTTLKFQPEAVQNTDERLVSTETFSLSAVIRRSRLRIQRPGRHWFFLLYLAGVFTVFALATLLKFTVNLL